MPPEAPLESLAEKLRKTNQIKTLRFWNELSNTQRQQLCNDLEAVPIDALIELVQTYVVNRPPTSIPGTLQPANILRIPPLDQLTEDDKAAWETGAEAIRADRVAAFTVAGGQGTRLGFPGPKGLFRISPIRNASLFQLFAESLRGVGRRWGRIPRWYIMTSPSNHDETVEYFRENGNFGLPPDRLRFFMQGQMPAFTPEGHIAMSDRHRILLSPDGHGGSLRALASSGALEEMRRAGVDYISYFQVDNPLAKPIDPMFLGLHIRQKSEMSSKAVHKVSDTERVGNFCIADGRLCVIEYSDLPEQIARAKNPDGSRRFDAGSIAIHILNRNFAERLVAHHSPIHLPWHRADKRSPILVGDGPNARIELADVVKLEMFIFDAIPLAQNPVVLYVDRSEEFSPVKNAEGADSPATAQRDLVRRAAAWLEQAGCEIPRTANGEPAATIEIAPSFALDASDLRERLSTLPRIAPGDKLLLE